MLSNRSLWINCADIPSSFAFCPATASAFSEISQPTPLQPLEYRRRLKRIHPLPVHTSRISMPSLRYLITSSTRVSVSCLGTSTSSVTEKRSPINSCQPVICCSGSCALLLSMKIRNCVSSSSVTALSPCTSSVFRSVLQTSSSRSLASSAASCMPAFSSLSFPVS